MYDVRKEKKIGINTNNNRLCHIRNEKFPTSAGIKDVRTIKPKHLPLLFARTAEHLFFITGFARSADITAGNRPLKRRLLNNPDMQDHSPINYSVV